MKGLFIDANEQMHDVFRRVLRPGDPHTDANTQNEVAAHELPGLIAGYDFILDDHTTLPTETMAQCKSLKHVVFLGTGARSDTAVAEHAIALMWAAARDVAAMDRAIRAGFWPRTEGMQLTGKTIGLLGYGGIGAEVARIAGGSGMRVLAWNRSPKAAPGVTFVDLDTLLAESDGLSVHLLLTDETRGFLSAARLAQLRPGAILVNTARGALIDEAALADALRSGRLRHAALDVFVEEPLPAGHPLSGLSNVTLSAHSAFRTPEASENLIRRGLDIARRLAG